jgi:outer membrane protein assembly factor BamB
MKSLIAIPVLTLTALALPLSAADWPQYAGPNGNRSTPENIRKAWPADGPKSVWRTPTQSGFSSFAVTGGRAFTIVSRSVDGAQREVLVACDANTGKELWTAPIGTAKYDGGGDAGTPDNKGGDGPRSTPSIDGNRVYAFSARLGLGCFDADSGKSLWSHDLMTEFAGRNIQWQSAASPLIEGDLVFVAGGGAGQSILAFNKLNGSLAWKQHDEKITHATPVAATIHGQRQVIFFMQSGLIAVNPKDGAVLWKHPFRYSVSTAASPVVGDDIVYCAAGYGVGATAVRISKEGGAFKAGELWRTTGNQPVANHWSTPVYHQGHLYGMFSFKEYGNGPVKCVELATGKVKWEKPGFGAGQVILAGNAVLALGDKGELVAFDPSPTAYNEIARAKIVTGKCWSSPTLANGRVFVRSTKEAVCLDAGAVMAGH